MALNLQVARRVDPRVVFKGNTKAWTGDVGTSYIINQKTADSLSNNVLLFSPTTSMTDVIDRSPYFAPVFYIQCSNGTGGFLNINSAALATAGSQLCGPRQYPFHSTLNAATFNPRGAQFVFNSCGEIIHAIMRYSSTPEDRQTWLSGTPHYPDIEQVYAQNNTNRSEFASYDNSLYEDSRNTAIWLF